MLAYLNRRNLLLAAISAVILFYFSTIALVVYLLILLTVAGIFHWGSANGAVKLADFLTNTATLVATLLILAVLLEIALHLKPHFFIGNQDPDTLGEFSDFTTRGYWSEDVFKKEKGVFRILGLGDSFAVYAPGNNATQNYNSLMQEKFAARGRGKVEIVNAGIPAVGPGYYRRILEKFGDRIQPDLVLVGFFVGNDFEEHQFFINIGNYISEPQNLNLKIWGYGRFKKTRLGKLIRRKYVWFLEDWRMRQEVREAAGQNLGSFSNETFLEIEKERSWIFQKDKKATLERHWRQCAEVISQMKHWCDVRKVELVLAIFPDQFQVDGDLRRELSDRYGMAADSLDLQCPNYLVSSFCEQNRIHCLDLLAPFQQAGKSAQLYVLRNTHWNEAGNRLAADLIFKYLEGHKLIKSD